MCCLSVSFDFPLLLFYENVSVGMPPVFSVFHVLVCTDMFILVIFFKVNSPDLFGLFSSEIFPCL